MKELFAEFGEITSVRLLNRRTDLPGKCFLEFQEATSAAAAVTAAGEKGGFELHGEMMRVE